MKFLKGLYKDSALVDQPQSTHRDALNMVMNLDKGSVSTEYGNQASNASSLIQASIPKVIGQDRKINGSILLPDNKFLVFYSQRYTNTTDKKSASFIYLFDSEGDQMTLLFATASDVESDYYSIDSGDLNFSPEYPVTGEARVAANGDIIAYFTDNFKDIKVDGPTGIEYFNNYNPPRVFNITRQLDNLKSGAAVTALYTNNLVSKFGKSGKNVNYLNLFLTTTKIPQIKDHKLVKGGILESGAYYLCLAYATEEFTETNIYTVSQPVYIPKGNYLDNGVTPAVPFEHMSGAPANTQTSFAIRWVYAESGDTAGLTVDTDYPYLAPYIIKVSGTTRSAYKLPLIPIEVDGSITFTGNENYATSSVEDIVLDKATYLTAKSMAQLDNKLYLNNLTARKDIGYQRFANAIELSPVVKQIKRFDNRVYDVLNLNYGYTEILKKHNEDGTYYSDFDDYKIISNYYAKYQLTSIYDGDDYFWIDSNTPSTVTSLMGGYRNQKAASYLKSYRRGEVYAKYISFILNDGTETYAYHIPGRQVDRIDSIDTVTSDSYTFYETGYTEAPNPEYLAVTSEIGSAEQTSVTNPDLKERLGNYHYSKIYDTSQEVTYGKAASGSAAASMGYWENENEFYPETDDFEVFTVDVSGNAENSGQPLYTDLITGENKTGVRHHKYPSNLNPDFAFIQQDKTNLYRVYIPSSGTPTGEVEESMLINLRTATANWDDQINQSAFFYETINVLGFKLSNIRIPKFILGQVQGFKVYYAKRTLENKTVIGQSLVHPSFFRNHGFFATNRLSAEKKARGPFHRYWSFYGNIPDINSGGLNHDIKYDSKYIGRLLYDTSAEPSDNSLYFGSPIVKFHDFSMLRNKTNLNIVDFVSIQSMVTMHQYSGAFRNITKSPGVRASTTITNITYLAGYEFFLSGRNENEEFSWVHADLGNTYSKLAKASTTGALDDWAIHFGPTALFTNVMLAARYTSYSKATFAGRENSTGAFTNQFVPHPLANVFTITNNGVSYINGLNYLKVTETDAYHGAQYLDNYAGETGIAISLKSGLPTLLGYVTSTDPSIDTNEYDTEAAAGTLLLPQDPNEEGSSSALARGKANIFLANLNSYKTDVFNPFDAQQLVWTGYYHPLQITEQSYVDGSIGGDDYNPDILAYTFQHTENSSTVLATYNVDNNYYTGLSTGSIFGGDTFICRYGYRSTSSDFPNYYITQNVTSDPVTPSVIDTITSGYGSQMSLPENIYIQPTPTSLTTPYNLYLGAVAFMNQRVLRTYGGPGNEWPNITQTGFDLLTNFLTLIEEPPITSGNPDAMYQLKNFSEQSTMKVYSTLYSVFVESDDNLNFRHAGDVVKGVGKDKSLFFDSYNAAEIVFRSPLIDLSKQDNLLYEDHYSAVQDIKTTIPFPKKGEIETSFPSRIVRSNVQDGRIDDNYRAFLALQYKDFSQNKGAITNLVALNGILFIHTEKSLYKTTGKQNLQLGDTTEAYIGSGDIFAQEPIELVTSNEGYAGNFNKFGAITNKYGYVFVSRKEKKVFLLTDKLEEISQQGLETWFRINIPYTLETLSSNNPYPVNLDTIPYLNLDAPTGSFGFISTYDPIFKRFIISKKELVPSDTLKELLTDYFNPSIINNLSTDMFDCLNDYSEIVNPQIPYGTGVNAIGTSTNLVVGYFGSAEAIMWFDPQVGGYIFTKALGDILTANGNITWENYVTEITLPITAGGECLTDTFYLINIINDNYWFKENGWTLSYYPDNKSWVSRHSYVSPWYFYNSEAFFSFESHANASAPDTFKIWRHNSTNGVQFYGTNYNYEFEFVINDSPDLTKIVSAINLNADVFTKDETGTQVFADSTTYLKDRLNSYNIQLPFSSFYIYNTYQNSGVITFDYLNNIRRIEGTWVFNNFRDIVKYAKSGSLSNNEYNVSGGFNNNVQTPSNILMFLDEGVINPNILNTTKPWYEQKKFMDKFFAVRLIGQGNNNLVNLYSANATLRKSSR